MKYIRALWFKPWSTTLVTDCWNRSHLSWIFSRFLTFTLHTFVLTQMCPSPSPMLSRAYLGALKWQQTQINIGEGEITRVFQDLWQGLKNSQHPQNHVIPPVFSGARVQVSSWCLTENREPARRRYEGSNSGYATKPKTTVNLQAVTKTQWNTSQYIASKSFLFISLKEKLDLILFSVRRSQYFICHMKSDSFSWPPRVSCRYVSKTPFIFPDVFFRLSWSSIKRSGLLRHNKPEMLLVVICVLLGSLDDNWFWTEWCGFRFILASAPPPKPGKSALGTRLHF